MEYFNKEFCLEVWGDYACFTRPEMKVERVSYDIITPSAARSIFEAIFWKPAIKWNITRIEVLKPIRWLSVRRNEVGKLISPRSKHILIEDNRQQRAGLFLKDVAYRLFAELEFIPVDNRLIIKGSGTEGLVDSDKTYSDGDFNTNPELGKDENPGKYNAIFLRRAGKGQCFNQPYLGCREFTANFRLIEKPETSAVKPISETRDLGFMLFDMDFGDPENPTPMFFRAKMMNGVVVVPPILSGEVHK